MLARDAIKVGHGKTFTQVGRVYMARALIKRAVCLHLTGVEEALRLMFDRQSTAIRARDAIKVGHVKTLTQVGRVYMARALIKCAVCLHVTQALNLRDFAQSPAIRARDAIKVGHAKTLAGINMGGVYMARALFKRAERPCVIDPRGVLAGGGLYVGVVVL